MSEFKSTVKSKPSQTAENCSFVCSFGVFRPTQNFFTHLQTSPLPVKGCKF